MHFLIEKKTTRVINVLIRMSFILAFFTNPLLATDVSIIHAGKLLAVPGEAVMSEKSIIIKDGIITEILDGYVMTDKLDLADDDTVQVTDLKKMFVLPGLIDTHVHLLGQLGPVEQLGIVQRSDADTALLGAHYASVTLKAGFTTVRDLGARGDDAVFALRDAINKGYVPGPRLYVAGHTISPTGGHGQRNGFSDDVFQILKSRSVCDGVSDCRRAVREQVRRSADQIKLVATGGVLTDSNSGTGQQFFDDELKAIIDTAHSLGRKVTAHAHDAEGINAALRAGVDSIEHGSFSNEESYRLFRETGAYLVPTILAGVTVTEIAENPNGFFTAAIRDKALKVGSSMIESTRKANSAGVKIVFGTDSYVSKHGQNAREFELLVQAGLSTSEAIRAATVLAADHMGLSDKIGTIELQKYADIIAVNENPLDNISELRKVDFVMKQGVVYHSE
jgi:imidazolonepropionase-like amidohydrolase